MAITDPEAEARVSALEEAVNRLLLARDYDRDAPTRRYPERDVGTHANPGQDLDAGDTRTLRKSIGKA